MWPALLPLLSCPACRGGLAAFRFDGHRRIDPDEATAVESGLLTCRACRTWFPIAHAVPVLLPFATPLHAAFARAHEVRIATLAIGYTPVAGAPKSRRRSAIDWKCRNRLPQAGGREAEARVERALLAELGAAAPSRDGFGWFLDAACDGEGLVARIAHTLFHAPAVGMSDGPEVFQAAVSHGSNRSLHFVQGSVEAPPFRARAFAAVYARGALGGPRRPHEARASLSELCSEGGAFFVSLPGGQARRLSRMRRAARRGRETLASVMERTARWMTSGARFPANVARGRGAVSGTSPATTAENGPDRGHERASLRNPSEGTQ